MKTLEPSSLFNQESLNSSYKDLSFLMNQQIKDPDIPGIHNNILPRQTQLPKVSTLPYVYGQIKSNTPVVFDRPKIFPIDFQVYSSLVPRSRIPYITMSFFPQRIILPHIRQQNINTSLVIRMNKHFYIKTNTGELVLVNDKKLPRVFLKTPIDPDMLFKKPTQDQPKEHVTSIGMKDEIVHPIKSVSKNKSILLESLSKLIKSWDEGEPFISKIKGLTIFSSNQPIYRKNKKRTNKQRPEWQTKNGNRSYKQANQKSLSENEPTQSKNTFAFLHQRILERDP